VRPDRSSLVGEAKTARRPPQGLRERAVVATRAPRLDPAPPLERSRAPKPRADRGATEVGPHGGSPPRLVKPPRDATRDRVLERPPFGSHSESERSMPPPAPRYQQPAERRTRLPEQPTQAAPSPQRYERAPRPERFEPPKPELPERSEPARPGLPGQPANRVYRSERYESPGVLPRGHSPAVREPRSAPVRESPGAGGKSRGGGGFGEGVRGPGH